MSERPFRDLSGEELRKRLRCADAQLGRCFDRFYLTDPEFKSALDLSLSLEDEQAERKNRND